MTLRVVVDTNVLVSGLLTVAGPPARVLELVRDGQLIPLLDDRILAEYRAVLARRKFRSSIQPAQAQELLADFQVFGEIVPATQLDIVYPDAKDIPFIEVAVAGRAHAVITGNLDDFPPLHGIRILAPAAFLEYYATSKAQQS